MLFTNMSGIYVYTEGAVI